MRYVLFLLVLWMLPLGKTSAREPLHVVLLGDSNTWLGGDSCNQAKGWSKWFCDIVKPTSIRSYARSGATWTHTEMTKKNTTEYTEVLGDDNVIMNQIYRMEEAIDSGTQVKPDFILILAGTNDAWFRSEELETSLAKTVNSDCWLLSRIAPKARIVLLTPMRSKQAGTAIYRAGDIIEETGRNLELEVIRLDGIKVETYDGTHTTQRGARQIGEFVAKKVKR